LQEIIEPETAGNPMSEQKWVRSSLRHLSKELSKSGHLACPKTVARLLKKADYSLKVNSEKLAGAQHPDRNMQFEYIQAQKELFLRHNWPVISVDAKKIDFSEMIAWQRGKLGQPNIRIERRCRRKGGLARIKR
jgi:hypothetical protein